MVQVFLLNEAYRRVVPHDISPVVEFNTLKRELSGSPDLIDRTTQQLKSHAFGFSGNTTIEDIVKQQRLKAYLAGKGVVVLYAESTSREFNEGIKSAFPYNLNPEMSLATLVALAEKCKKGYHPELFESIKESSFAYSGVEAAVVNEALRYLEIRLPFTGIARRDRERDIRSTARTFMEAYESLKREIMNNGKNGNDFKSFVLMLAYAATYSRINEMFKEPYDFNERFPFSHEFFDIPARDIDINEVLGYIGKTPIKKYWTEQEFDKWCKINGVNKNKLWSFVRARLTKEPSKAKQKSLDLKLGPTTKNVTRNPRN